MPSGQLTSFDEYISRMEPGQDKIYFVVAPTRAHAESSPYMEAFNGDEAKGTAHHIIVIAMLARPSAIPTPGDAASSMHARAGGQAKIVGIFMCLADWCLHR